MTTPQNNATPVAFLCHCFTDKHLAQRIAHDLRTNGIDVWYDSWEVKPGDSLRRKIDQGISQAQYFLVLLTPSFENGKWAQTELDAGIVQQIQGQCRLIPLVSDLIDPKIPPTLLGTVRIRMTPYQDGLQELIETILGISKKPPLGQLPTWGISNTALTTLKLTPVAQQIAKLLNDRSEDGLEHDPLLELSEVVSCLEGISEKTVARAAEELKEYGMVLLAIDANSPYGFHAIGTTPALFYETDKFLKGWDTQSDAKTVVATLFSHSESQSMSLSELCTRLSWSSRRLNPAVQFLVHNGYAKAHKAYIPHYAYPWIMLTPKGRLFGTD